MRPRIFYGNCFLFACAYCLLHPGARLRCYPGRRTFLPHFYALHRDRVIDLTSYPFNNGCFLLFRGRVRTRSLAAVERHLSSSQK